MTCPCVNLDARRGIAVAASDKYAQDLYASLKILRHLRGCSLPIEVWHSGDELSDHAKKKFISLGDVEIHDIVEYYAGAQEEYWGYHIKGYMTFASFFDELIVMDADVFFFDNPERLFEHPAMVDHAAYFFRDREDFRFRGYERKRVYVDRYFTSYFTYKQRRDMVLSLIPNMPKCMPPDWRHYWTKNPSSLKFPIPSEHQDAGCIVIDKKRSDKSCEFIKIYNEFHDIFYRYILGDKETFWMAFAACDVPFFVNGEHPYRLRVDETEREMIHFLDGELFFMQKHPVEVTNMMSLLRATGRLGLTRLMTANERFKFNELYIYYMRYYEEFYEK